MKIYGTWHAFLIEQLKEKEDVGGFLDAVIEEYQIHRNLATVQLALQYVVEAQGGISELAPKIDIEPQVLSEMLDSTKTPKTDTLRTVLIALGCHPSIKSLETVNTPTAAATDGSAVAPIEAVDPNRNLD
jgi:DNA-binding phage protein